MTATSFPGFPGSGNLTGCTAQVGTILIGGNAGEALGGSLYETTIYVADGITSTRNWRWIPGTRP